MDTNIRINKKNFYLKILIFIIILISLKIHYIDYFIDGTNFEEIKPINEYISPDGKYILLIRLIKLRDREKENEYYILGQVVKNKVVENMTIYENEKVIYWNKSEGNFYKDTIYCEWIDNNTIKIENKKLNIIFSKRYFIY